MRPEQEECKWKKEKGEEIVFETSCGAMHLFIDGGIRDNSYKYCPYCGGEITGRYALKTE